MKCQQWPFRIKRINANLVGLTPDRIKKVVSHKSIGQRSVRMEDAVLVQWRVVNDIHNATVHVAVYGFLELEKARLSLDLSESGTYQNR